MVSKFELDLYFTMLYPSVSETKSVTLMVLVRYISRSHWLKIDFRDENFYNFIVLNHKALIFGILHHLFDLYQVCSNFTPGTKSGPAQGVTGFHRLI